MTAPSSEPRKFALASERVITPQGCRPAAVIVHGQCIDRVAAPDDPELAEIPVEDLGSRVIMPGMIDTHVHVDEPGGGEREGFATATRAAAAGGVTAVIDMPLRSTPVTTTAEALEAKRAACAGKLFVDVGFWGGVTGQSDDQFAALVESGILGGKAFLCDTGVDDFPRVGEEDLRRAMAMLASAGLPLVAHAELQSEPPPTGSDPRSYADYLASRPESLEQDAIALLVRLADDTDCAVHIAHLSAASALPAIAKAQQDGVELTAETCPHYLILAAESIADGATEFKCDPPIRSRDNQEQLWLGLGQGTINMVVSGHSPCSPRLEKHAQGDFTAAHGGISSLQLTLPLLWTEARNRGHNVFQIANWLCAEPARVADIDNKGRLVAGCDADLCVWDPDRSFEVAGESLFMRHGGSTPYEGQTLFGVVERTYLRGEPIFSSGQLVGGPRGRAILRQTQISDR